MYMVSIHMAFLAAAQSSSITVTPGLPLEHGELVVEQLGSCGGLATMRADRSESSGRPNIDSPLQKGGKLPPAKRMNTGSTGP